MVDIDKINQEFMRVVKSIQGEDAAIKQKRMTEFYDLVKSKYRIDESDFGNHCKWIKYGTTDTCGKFCRGDWCDAHYRAVVTQGRENHVCKVCGKGVRSKSNLCKDHGRTKYYNDRHNSIIKEYNRLKRISTDIFS